VAVIDPIWWDAESNLGKGAKSEYASEEVNLGPENKMPIPCDGCEQSEYCRANSTDCQAFREWSDKGYYGVFAKDGNFTGVNEKGHQLIGFRLKPI